MVVATLFPSRPAMEQLVSMGMEEGIAAAMDRIAEILAEVVTTRL